MDKHGILREYFGHTEFRNGQEELIDNISAGRDVLGVMPTGAGKSICYQVPALMMNGVTLVVSPLISLMADQVAALVGAGVKAAYINSSLTYPQYREVLRRAREGRYKIIYVAPERLLTEEFLSLSAELEISMLTVDEAHCVSQWGQDFRPSYLKIAEYVKTLSRRPVVSAFTATATGEVRGDIVQMLGLNDPFVITTGFDRKNLYFGVLRPSDKFSELTKIIRRNGDRTGIVYCLTRKTVEEVCEKLCATGVAATRYHAGLSDGERRANQEDFICDRKTVMVATNAFGMGIDKPDVRIVVHHDLPSSLEEYYQEAGRAGRDGLPSWAVVLATSSDKGTLTRRLSESFPEKDFIRGVYGKMCVSLGIAMGEGYNRNLEFPFGEFCDRWGLPPAMADSALKILAQAGYFEYTEELTTRSRLMMTVDRRTLYDIEVSAETERVLQFILRNYTGIFADYEYIDEAFIASSLELTERSVYEALIRLRKMHVIDFVPRRRSPYIYMLSSRVPDSDIILPKTVYENRRRQMSHRLEMMKRFVFDDFRCRVVTMLSYFGEKAAECGTCDVCRSRRRLEQTRRGRPAVPEQVIEEAIINVLGQSSGEITLLEVAERLRLAPVALFDTVRSMADSGRLRIISSESDGGMLLGL